MDDIKRPRYDLDLGIEYYRPFAVYDVEDVFVLRFKDGGWCLWDATLGEVSCVHLAGTLRAIT